MAENVTLGSFATLQNSSIISTLNSNNALITTAFADCVSLSGVSPNQMQANLDMNNNQILNLPAPSTVNSPARLADVVASISAAVTVNYSRYNFTLKGVNFNSANTDNAVSIALPAGFTRYRIANIVIENASASLSSATCGVFSAVSAGGTAIVTTGTSVTVSTSSTNTNNNMQSLTINNQSTLAYQYTTLYFRVQSAEGSVATADVVFMIDLLT